ncbi:hypothetical protein NFJ02_17g27580 [Pycnococcus provasolii]
MPRTWWRTGMRTPAGMREEVFYKRHSKRPRRPRANDERALIPSARSTTSAQRRGPRLLLGQRPQEASDPSGGLSRPRQIPLFSNVNSVFSAVKSACALLARPAEASGGTAAAKKQKAIDYEVQTRAHEIDLSESALEAAGLRCIKVIEERIEEYKLLYPAGFMLSIYGTSTGSHSIEHEGKMQLTSRGNSIPPIVDGNGNTIAMGEQGAHGPGGESVFDCGSSRVTSKEVEKAAQRHFTPLCDASNGMMPRT